MLLVSICVLYSNVTYIYPVTCLVEIKLFQIVSKSTYLLQCSRARYEIFSRKILVNIDAGRHYDFIFFLTRTCTPGFSSVIVFGFEYCAVKFPIIYFVVIMRIMRNVIIVGYVLVIETIIVRLFQCN